MGKWRVNWPAARTLGQFRALLLRAMDAADTAAGDHGPQARRRRATAADDPGTLLAEYTRCLPRLRRVVAGLGFAPADADDILQSVFVAAAENPGDYRGPAEAEAWWCRLVVNASLLEYRRRQRFQKATRVVGSELERAAGSHDAEAGTAGGVRRAEDLERVRAALQEMDGRLAVPLVLRYWCGMDATEIGALLEIPPATIRGRLRAARLWLADRLDPPE